MYLKISKNVLINFNEIIAILNINSLIKKENLENVCKKMKISDNIIDVSDNNQKSLIITKKGEEIKGYMSSISTNSLEKRANKMEVKNNGKI